jgi:hypothetical protein
LRYKLQVLTTARKLTKLDRLERTIWKAIYFQRLGTEPLYKAETERPVAVESPDHKWPRGTAFDNSSNRNFNFMVASLLYWGRVLGNVSYAIALCSWVLIVVRMSQIVLVAATSFPALDPHYLWPAQLRAASRPTYCARSLSPARQCQG